MLDPRCSELTACFWGTAHCLAAVGLVLSGLPLPLCLVAAVLLVCHALIRAPRRAPAAVVQANGVWTVPAWGIEGLRPAHGSYRTPWLVRVVLIGPKGRRIFLVARDALTADQWRRLQVLLRS